MSAEDRRTASGGFGTIKGQGSESGNPAYGHVSSIFVITDHETNDGRDVFIVTP
jgi:hypothetical protein